MAELLVKNKNDIKKYRLQPINTIGREKGNTIQILDTRTSRFHAKILEENGSVILIDLKSRNKTMVNGKEITRHVLTDGDIIQIGDAKIIFYAVACPDSVEIDSHSNLISKDVNSKIKASYSKKLTDDSKDTREELDETHRRLSTIYKAANIMGSILDLDKLLEKLLDLLFEEFSPQRACIIMIEKAGKKNVLVPGAVRFRMDTDNVEIPISRTIINEVVEKRISILSHNAMKDERFKRGDSIVYHGIRSAVCAPLLYQDDILGVIHLDSNQVASDFTEEDLKLLTGIASQAAVAIQNASLFKARYRFRTNLISLQEAAQQLSSYLDYESIYEDTVKYACSLMGASRVSLIQRREGEDFYRVVYAIGIAQDVWENTEIRIGEGIAGKVIFENKPLLFNSSVDDQEVVELVKYSVGKYTNDSFIIVPIPSKARKLGRDRGEQLPLGVLCVTGKGSNHGIFTEEDVQLLTILATQVGISLANASLYERATVDELTGLYIRRFFDLTLDDEIKACRTNDIPLSLLVMDLDRFKQVNDTYGHQAGDLVMSVFGKMIRSKVRREDIACRYGGEEFAVIAPDIDIENAQNLGERIRHSLEQKLFEHNGQKFNVTISVGVAQLSKDDNSEILFEKADSALYEAKGNGRNQVVIYKSGMSGRAK